jgi:hypothetical protein
MAGFVTVACKYPPGVIIRGFKMVPRQEIIMGGQTRDIVEAVPTGEIFVIKGPGAPFGQSPKAPVSSGFALTANVDAAVWEQWLAQNKDSELVRNGLIFAHAKPAELDAVTRANETRRTGLEPMTPDGDPRMPKSRTQLAGGALSGLETAARGAGT